MPDRPEYVAQQELIDAAIVFVAAIGWRNADYLSKNLDPIIRRSDALRALDSALIRDFNIRRQDEIRQAR